MQYCKVNGMVYPAISFFGRCIDNDWDGRESTTINIQMTYAQAAEVFTDGCEWSIIDEEYDELTNQTVQVEYDNSYCCIAGDITDHRDGTVSVKMGRPTDLEEAYELLYGGE